MDQLGARFFQEGLSGLFAAAGGPIVGGNLGAVALGSLIF